MQKAELLTILALQCFTEQKNEPEFVLNNTQMKNIISNIVDPRMARRGNGENKVTNYNFGNIELPNVQNARQFMSELKSLVNITKHQ